MKHRWRTVVRVAVGVAIIAALPGIAAVESRNVNLSPEAATFSRESGFYDEPFFLEMDGHGAAVYYTLDSTDPDENSLRYTGPILIEDASANENVYSMIRDVVLGLNPEYLTDNGETPKFYYELPQEPVDKATVVKAVCVDADGNRSAVTNAVYFVGFGEKTGYEGFMIMSVTTDPKNLFGYETGIYVLGRKFDDIVEDGKVVAPQGKSYSFWPANYRERGSEWEREAYVCCFDDDGTLIASGNYGIRIQGGASRAWLPKGLNIIGRRKYESDYFDGNKLFGKAYQLTTLNLSSGANDIDTMLKDYIVNAFSGDLDVGVREYTPCALFLDGEYWGIYWMTPRYKEDYLSEKYGVDAANVVEIKRNKLEVGREEDTELYEDMLAFIADHDMSQPDNYSKACEMIDIDSCVDYYALEQYIANYDWPSNNKALWRTRVAALNQYSDCKWRWMVYDVNLAMQTDSAEEDMTSHTVNRDAMFASLMSSPEFSSAIRARMLDLAMNTFETGRVEAFIEAYKKMMAGPMEKKYRRFYGENRTLEYFFKRCDAVTEFFRARNEYIIRQYGENSQ